ncbi:phage host specificity protein [Proteus vulgaris]|uniref:TipJ family phage tail tip protein n=1 Tax=Proteus vulgaris TaxID=585 RepID=UPI000DFC07D5|nr:phage tail protein [Proteus vulgaris]SUC22786.1 phage host specificity protein [Proteus vulgaris]
MRKTIHGQKGGGGNPRVPVEQPDDLQSIAKAKLLIALGEGEFAGELTAQNIFLDGTPLEDTEGNANFSGVTWDFRPGTQAQTYIQGLPSAENEINVGSTISSKTPWVHTFTNSQLSAIRVRLKWPSLFKQEDNGDLVGNEVKYAIDLQTDGGSWKTVIDSAVKGKTTSGYERAHRIDLPESTTSWSLRVRKVSNDANSSKIGDTVVLQSYTEVIDAKFTYPHTALLYIEFDSKQFNGSIPQITCKPKGRIIRIPSNYNPIDRTYTGMWDGSFKWAWTNNPAWVFYDIVISDRFGLGQRINQQQIDKWELYRIAQYCDQLVPDGKGGDGTEPRYVCDVYVQDRNEAYNVLRDFAAIFRGMTYWGGGQIVTLADMPRDIDYSYTRANVIDGKFIYSSSSSKEKYSTALVSYSDPQNGYADAMEPVFEPDLVSRFGFNQLEVTAIGCTRQSEANRKGRWGILTNNKDRMVTFSVGLDGNIPQPGYIIAVADELLSGKVTGGRVSATDGRNIMLDRVSSAVSGDRLILNLPSGQSQARTIQTVSGKVITVTTEYSETPETECVWVVESEELYAQQYRVVSVTENESNQFTITAIQHEPSKYEHIDSGAVIDERPISVIPPNNQQAPKNIVIDSYSIVSQGVSIETMRAQWPQVENAISYEAQWRRNEGNWVNMPRSSINSIEVPNVYSGRYLVRVRAINASEISSGWGYSDEKTLTGKMGNPPKPVNFRTSPLVFGIKLDWGFGENTSDTLKTEIQYSKTNDGEGLMLLSDVPYPSKTYEMAGLSAGVEFYFRARLVDKTGNQSEWTEFIRGESEFDVGTILPELDGHFMSSEAGQQLSKRLDWNAETALILSNADSQLSRSLLVKHGQSQAGIKELWQVRATDNEAWAQEVKEIYSAVGDNKSAIKETQTSITNLDEAIGQRFTEIRTEVNQAQADIVSNSQAISNTNEAFAENKTQVQAKFNEQEGLIQEKMQATFNQSGDGVVTHSINITIVHDKVKYNAAGQVISAQVKNGKLESFFGYNANNFAWYNPANGKMELFMYAKNGQLFIRDLFIEDGSITNAKIGNVIQSNNYVMGKSGWIINKNGFAEFQNIKARGEIEATSGRLKNVVIEKSCEILGTLNVENLEGNIVTVTQDVYRSLSFPHSEIVELFKVKRRTQKCFIWVQGALNPYERIPNNGVRVENRAAFAYRAPGFGYNGGEADIYIDGIIQPKPNTYNMEGLATPDFYAVNEFVLELSPGEGVASIGIKIPRLDNQTTRFIMRARIIVFPDNQDVIF